MCYMLSMIIKMKTCSKCGEQLDASYFYKDKRTKSGLYSKCITCQKQYMAKYHQDNKPKIQKQYKKIRLVNKRKRQLFVLKYLQDHHCIDCGETDPIVLEFDHARGKKIASISHMIAQTYSEENIMREIEKCDVRCSNCHKRITAKLYDWYSYIDFNKMSIKNFRAKAKTQKRHLM